MHSNASNYPPGVTGREPQITGKPEITTVDDMLVDLMDAQEHPYQLEYQVVAAFEELSGHLSYLNIDVIEWDHNTKRVILHLATPE